MSNLFRNISTVITIPFSEKLKQGLVKTIAYNPFFIYALSFIFSLILYSFNWSDTYPNLKLPTFLFLFTTIIISVLLGINTSWRKISPYEVKLPPEIIKVLYASTLVCYVIFVMTFVYKGIPFYLILFTNNTFNYYDYRGIQFLTILAITLNAVCMSLYFILFQKFKKLIFLLLFAGTIFPLILLFNRSYLFISFLPILFYIIVELKRKHLIFFALICTLGLYLFGVFGDRREEAKNREQNNSFYDSYLGIKYPKGLKKEFFWSYFYYTSPLGKLQHTIDDPIVKLGKNDILGLVIHEIIPNSMGVRLTNKLNLEKRVSTYGYPEYFAGTCYNKAFLYGKWGGMLLYMVALFSFVFIIFLYFQKTKSWVFLSIVLILNSIMILSIFSNMLNYTAFYLMIFWLLVINQVTNAIIRKNNRVKIFCS